MLHIALCDDNPASIEILEKYFDILNDSTIDYDVYFSAEELYRYKLNNELTYDIYILDIEMQCKFCSNGTPILKSAVHSF